MGNKKTGKKSTDWNVTAAWSKAAFDTTYAFGSTIGQYGVNRITAGMNADAYRSQARLRLLEAERQQGYINEEVAQDVWNATARGARTISTANAAMGASGFDVSAGDQRIFSNIENEVKQYAAGRNRTAYLQSFETQLDAYLEANRLEYAAKAQDVIKKYNSGGRALTAGLFNALGAFASNLGVLGEAGAFGKGGTSTDIKPAGNGA